MVETRRTYVAFLCKVTAERGIKNMVLLPDGIRVPTPWARRPRSLAKAVIHVLDSGPVERSRYSRLWLDIGSMTAFE